MVICTCGKQHKGYTALSDLDSGNPCYDLWVCANCHLPSRKVFKALTSNLKPSRATLIKHVSGDGHGRNFITWATEISGETITTMTFKPYPRKVDMAEKLDQGREVLTTLWVKLDECIDQIRGLQTDNTLIEAEKLRANTYAETLALLMSPYYESADAVLRESMARWTARQKNRSHESPGLAESIWDPSTRFDGTPYSKEAQAKVRNNGASNKAPVVFDEAKSNFIKHCLQTGAQSSEVLAGMFSCTVEDIKTVVD